jgi:hypothetical protein
MSTMVNSAEVEIRPHRNMGKLSERDFAVCETCGDPAMVHPRYELIASLFSSRPAFYCCACLHEMIVVEAPQLKRDAKSTRIGDQLWRCGECSEVRAWGCKYPDDEDLRPALRCAGCERVTRHRFTGVA